MTFWKTGVRVKEIVYIKIYTISLKDFRPSPKLKTSFRHYVISSLTPTSIPIICYAANGVGLGGRKGRVWDSVIRIFFIHDIHSLSIATIHLLHGGVQLANVVMTK